MERRRADKVPRLVRLVKRAALFTGDGATNAGLHAFPHERSDLSHWRKRLGDKLELLLAESLRVAHEQSPVRLTR